MLDLFCGQGKDIFKFKQYINQIAAFDSNSQSIEKYKETVKKHGIKEIKIE